MIEQSRGRGHGIPVPPAEKTATIRDFGVPQPRPTVFLAPPVNMFTPFERFLANFLVKISKKGLLSLFAVPIVAKRATTAVWPRRKNQWKGC